MTPESRLQHGLALRLPTVDREDARLELERRFDVLVQRSRDRALRVAWRIVGGDAAAAEDVVQDAFLSAHRGLARFRAESQLETWLYRIVVRRAQGHLRWRRVRARFARREAMVLADRTPAAPGDPMLRRQIEEALADLTRAQREAFVLVHMEGFTVREAAGILEKAEGTVKSHLQRALEKLRARLDATFAEVERREGLHDASSSATRQESSEAAREATA